jgi:hypothetical protein
MAAAAVVAVVAVVDSSRDPAADTNGDPAAAPTRAEVPPRFSNQLILFES